MNERFQVRQVNRPDGQFWQVFDTEKPDEQHPLTPDRRAAGAESARLNAQFGRGPAPKKHTVRNVLIVIGSLFGLLIVISALASGQPEKDAATPPAVVSPVDNGPTPDPITTPTNKPTVAKTTPAPKVTQPSMTASQEQAVGTAEDYLQGQSFSRKGLIEQLEFEGFSARDAAFGVDYLKVDWSAQAVEVAKNYLKSQHFSRAGLIEQLEFEGFTHKQAVYGVTKAGL